ncbi:MAG: polar amino acid transport system substrate-binding protein [Actinomycetota bacterium]|nr:polar amino acid transport system substrate-binding protein [Actinomycetota bacterium]
MRKFTVIGIIAALVFGLTACGSSNKTGSGTTTTAAASGSGGACGKAQIPAAAADFKPVVAGTLSVVTSLPGPGFWEGSDSDPTKLTSGYEYDIAKCMQTAFGLQSMKVRNVSFDAIVAGSVTKYDLALSQVSITPERAKVVSFSEPYFESHQGVLMRSDQSISTLAQAKKTKWGVQTATTALTLLKSIGVNNPKSYTDLANAYTALEAKQVDAVLIDTAINLGEAARSNGKFHVVAQFDQTGGPDKYGAILPKGSVNVAAVNAVFTSMKDSGELKALTVKDLTVDPNTLKTIPVIKVPTP